MESLIGNRPGTCGMYQNMAPCPVCALNHTRIISSRGESMRTSTTCLRYVRASPRNGGPGIIILTLITLDDTHGSLTRFSCACLPHPSSLTLPSYHPLYLTVASPRIHAKKPGLRRRTSTPQAASTREAVLISPLCLQLSGAGGATGPGLSTTRASRIPASTVPVLP